MRQPPTVVPVINGAFAFDVYAGPQESQRLYRMGREFDHVNPYGWGFVQGVVHPIASEVIRGLLWMHNRLKLSYGWVLIILGVLIRLALWPLNQSAMRSSLKMQEIQPKLQAAQKKYKDPLQQREAIMKVYKEAGRESLRRADRLSADAPADADPVRALLRVPEHDRVPRRSVHVAVATSRSRIRTTSCRS